jgi:hypothetical protein
VTLSEAQQLMRPWCDVKNIFDETQAALKRGRVDFDGGGAVGDAANVPRGRALRGRFRG